MTLVSRKPFILLTYLLAVSSVWSTSPTHLFIGVPLCNDFISDALNSLSRPSSSLSKCSIGNGPLGFRGLEKESVAEMVAEMVGGGGGGRGVPSGVQPLSLSERRDGSKTIGSFLFFGLMIFLVSWKLCFTWDKERVAALWETWAAKRLAFSCGQTPCLNPTAAAVSQVKCYIYLSTFKIYYREELCTELLFYHSYLVSLLYADLLSLQFFTF